MNSKIRVMQLVWRFSTGGAERMVINFHEHFKSDEQIEIKTLSFTPATNGIFEEQMKNDPAVAYIPTFWGDRLPSVAGKIARVLFKKRFRGKWLLKQITEFAPDIKISELGDMIYPPFVYERKRN